MDPEPRWDASVRRIGGRVEKFFRSALDSSFGPIPRSETGAAAVPETEDGDPEPYPPPCRPCRQDHRGTAIRQAPFISAESGRR